ncbi:efflux RND transporter periplasmic adaptor subunit [Chloroflexi bacterium TSY]|nr:efflux RND transporter periplasmic adaptor subunit [Chloroflexi bacterium TSY]
MIFALVLSACAIQPIALAAEAEEASAGESQQSNDSSNDSQSDGETEDEGPRTPITAATLEELFEVQAGRLDYNGEILAVDRLPVVAEVSGMILDVSVEVGDVVKAGDVIATLDSTTLEAQREQAFANLTSAQSQLELLVADPEPEDIEVAKASLDAATANYQRTLDGPTAEDLAIAETSVRQAEAGFRQAQAAYNEVRGNPQIAALPQSAALERATLSLEAAKAQFAQLQKGSTADAIAGAYAQVVSARAAVTRLEKGPKEAQIRSAEAQVIQAETSLYLAQLDLDKALVRAPIDGIVASVDAHVGVMAGGGSPLAVLLSHEVKVVIPVEEVRLSHVKIGQPAVIRVDAYPDRLFDGTIYLIAPELDPATRTVQVTIKPDSADATELKPGMFATVDLFALPE